MRHNAKLALLSGRAIRELDASIQQNSEATMEDKVKTQVVIVWALESSTTMAKALAVVADKANTYSGHSYSLQRYAEEAMSRGIKAIDNGIKSGTELRNVREYARERANLPTPPAGDAEAMSAYFAKIVALDRKYGIGGTQVAL